MGSLAVPSPIRLAILKADTPNPVVLAKYGDYGEIFKHLFERACAGLDPPQPLESQLILSSHDVVNDLTAYPDPETLDAVLISGSKHNSFENDEWILRLVQYTKRLLEGGRVRLIGVCFGHQIIARAMGTQVGRNVRGWEVSVVEVALTEEGKRIFRKDALKIQQMHRDAVSTYPPGTIPLAYTDACAVQGMYIPKRLITVQGHPEFTEYMVRAILEKRHNDGILADGLYKDAVNRVADEHDGVAIAQAFIRFLRE